MDPISNRPAATPRPTTGGSGLVGPTPDDGGGLVTPTAPAAPTDQARLQGDNPYGGDVDPDEFAAMAAAFAAAAPPRAPEDDGSTWGDWQNPQKPEFNFHHQTVNGSLWTKDANGDVVWADNGKRVAAGQVDLMPEGQRQAYFQLSGLPETPRATGPSPFKEPPPAGHWAYTEDEFGYGSSRLGGNGRDPVPVGGESGLGIPMPVAYDPQRDKARFDWSTHECVESSFCRVARWANDLVKFKGADPNQAFYASIQRLRQDFKNTDRDWSESGFAEVPLPG